MDTHNEDLAILHLVPEVNKEDFNAMAAELKEFFALNHGVHLMEVQPCSIGDAYVRFMSPVERERFLDRILPFVPDYQMYFTKHDEGKNARFQDVDREAWVMLMAYPTDTRNNTAISKAVSGFGLLRSWHDITNVARVVAKVNLHAHAKIPHGVLVSAGVPPRSRSWMCPVFVLKHKGITMLADEDPTPANGPLFPLPPRADRWRGPPQATSATGGQSSVGQQDVHMADGAQAEVPEPEEGEDAQKEAGQDVAMPDTRENVKEASDALMVIPLQIIPPEKVILLNQKVIRVPSIPFSIPAFIPIFHSRAISSIICDLDILVPPYLVDPDTLLFLASIVTDQMEKGKVVFGPAKPLVPYLPEDADSDDDSDLREIEGPIASATPKRRRAHKMKEPLEDDFRRRSKRLNPDIQGFRTKASQEAAQDYPNIYTASPAEPSSAVAPHLTPGVVQGIASSFLQMQPTVVSALVLEELDE
ncbi:unnamed protein product [Urochloa humidicola]